MRRYKHLEHELGSVGIHLDWRLAVIFLERRDGRRRSHGGESVYKYGISLKVFKFFTCWLDLCSGHETGKYKEERLYIVLKILAHLTSDLVTNINYKQTTFFKEVHEPLLRLHNPSQPSPSLPSFS
jgi:hypothetical protein